MALTFLSLRLCTTLIFSKRNKFLLFVQFLARFQILFIFLTRGWSFFLAAVCLLCGLQRGWVADVHARAWFVVLIAIPPIELDWITKRWEMLYKIHSFTKGKGYNFLWSALTGIHHIISRRDEVLSSRCWEVSQFLRWNSPWACPGAVPGHSAALLSRYVGIRQLNCIRLKREQAGGSSSGCAQSTASPESFVKHFMETSTWLFGVWMEKWQLQPLHTPGH